jgi:CheY-like chemotaxis protein
MRPNLIILDLSMPGTDGFTLHRQLQAEPVLGKARMVAYSALSDELNRQRAIEEGFDEYFVKARDSDNLFDMVAHAAMKYEENE